MVPESLAPSPLQAGRGRREPLEPSEGTAPCGTLLADSWSADPGEDTVCCPKAPHLWSLISSPRKPAGTQNASTGPAEENQRKGTSKGQLGKAQGHLWVHCPWGPYSTAVWRGPVLPGQGKGSPTSPFCPVCPSPRGSPTKTLKAKQKPAEMHVFKIYSKTKIALLFLERNGAF